MSGFHLVEELFSTVDSLTQSFADGAASRTIGIVLPVVNVSLVISMVTYGTMAAMGAVQQPMLEMIQRFFRISVIAAIATAGGFYQSDLIGVIQNTPDEFAAAVLQKTGVVASSGSNSLGAMIDGAADAGFTAANTAFHNSGIMSKQGLAWMAFAVVTALSTAIVVGVGAAFITVAKVSLCLLAAIGPLFIYCLLFKPVTRFFDNWLNQIVTTGLVIVLIAFVFSFLLGLYQHFMIGVKFDKGSNFAGQLGGGVILAIVAVILLFEVKTKAQGLGGGVSSGFGGAIAAFATGAAVAGALGKGMKGPNGPPKKDGNDGNKGGKDGGANDGGKRGSGKRAAGDFAG